MSDPGTYDLDTLLFLLESDPENVDLINRLAIAYFQNPRPGNSGRETLELLEKAYALKKSVKTTHNLGWYLYFEWSEIEWRWEEKGAKERAMRLQEECLEFHPRSFYPYFQMGQMLLLEGRYADALPYWEKAAYRSERREVRHNLAFCRLQTGDYETAKAGFAGLVKGPDPENRSLYNLAICEWFLGNKAEVRAIAQRLESEIHYAFSGIISGYEIGGLYYLLGEPELATRCMLKQGIDGIDVADWPELLYALYRTSSELWAEKLRWGIEERKGWIEEVRSGHQDWKKVDKEEQAELLELWADEIAAREKLLSEGMAPPVAEPATWAMEEYCGCLLFDCRQHGNPPDDALPAGGRP